MPIYLLHGFRWPRSDLRIHVIINNIDNAAPDYTMAASSRDAIIANLRANHPKLTADLPELTLVEEYDPDDLTGDAVGRPFAYVADKVYQADLCIDVKAAMDIGIKAEAWNAIADLKDAVAKDQKVGWYVVYNGDPERAVTTPSNEEEEEVEGGASVDAAAQTSTLASTPMSTPKAAQTTTPMASETVSESATRVSSEVPDEVKDEKKGKTSRARWFRMGSSNKERKE